MGKGFAVTDLKNEYNAVFLSPGLHAGRLLKISGIKEVKAIDALSLLNSYRKNGKIKVGKNVLVIGGGSVAADVALATKENGAAKVYPRLPRKKRRNAGATQRGQGDKRTVFDDQGKFSPSFDPAQTKELEFDQVIMAVGQCVEPGLAKYHKQEFGTAERLEVNAETMEIKDRPGIFAGGDIVRGAGTVVEAVADGRKAAKAISSDVKWR